MLGMRRDEACSSLAPKHIIGTRPGPANAAQYATSRVSVRPTASFQAAHAFDAVGVWTHNDNDQGGGEAVKKPNSWQSNVKRAALANGSSASSAECR